MVRQGAIQAALYLCKLLDSPAHVDLNNLQAQWNATDADDDETRNNIAHGFLSTKEPSAAPGLEQLLRLFLALMPEELHTFSVARSATLNNPFCLCHKIHLPPVM